MTAPTPFVGLCSDPVRVLVAKLVTRSGFVFGDIIHRERCIVNPFLQTFFRIGCFSLPYPVGVSSEKFFLRLHLRRLKPDAGRRLTIRAASATMGANGVVSCSRFYPLPLAIAATVASGFFIFAFSDHGSRYLDRDFDFFRFGFFACFFLLHRLQPPFGGFAVRPYRLPFGLLFPSG